VRLLDAIYSLFDALCVKHGVTKMETVGKTYMAASGLQQDRSDHAQALVLLGMDMIRTVAMVMDKSGKQAIHVRVGINSGKVVSGVVGLKKQQFSLFGDTVNTASRMQSCANTDEIRVSESTRTHLGSSVTGTVIEEMVKVRGCELPNTVAEGGHGGWVFRSVAG
jgi:phospholipid-transporting ATPase